MDGKHKPQRPQNRQHAGKQLSKAHQKAVGKLIHVGDHPADDLPVAVAVQIFKRQYLQAVKRLPSDVADYVVGDRVVADVHQPLSQGRRRHQNGDPFSDRQDPGKIHPPRAHDQVYRLPGQHRHIQGKQHRHGREQKTEPQKEPIAPQVTQNLY